MNPKEFVVLPEATVVFEPSVFGGDGTETRVNLVLKPSPASANAHFDGLRKLEASLNLDPCNSVVRPDVETLKCKIALDQVNAFDTDHQPIKNDQLPELVQWRNATVNARLEIRGTWKTRSGSGLSVVCADLQFRKSTEQGAAISPFRDVMACLSPAASLAAY
jgi:hypothetical protein